MMGFFFFFSNKLRSVAMVYPRSCAQQQLVVARDNHRKHVNVARIACGWNLKIVRIPTIQHQDLRAEADFGQTDFGHP